MSLLRDGFGRVHTNLRISVTDRCNIRCFYCMPEENVRFRPQAEILTFEEIERFTRVAVQLGITKLRLTGGEPLVRRGLPELVSRLAALPGVEDLALTTNGILLREQAPDLKRAGLHRLNISLDALTESVFEQIARRPGLDKVLDGIGAAIEAGFDRIRLNAVSIRGITESEIVPLAQFARQHGLELRFIEYMPLDAQHAWERQKVVPAARILAAIDAVHPLVPEGHVNEPATTFRFADGAPGRVGVIASVTEPFCDTCNRLRLTAEGMFRNCLFAMGETDLRAPMRGGASDDDLALLIRQGLWAKWSGHRINHPDFVQPARSMSMIGG